MAIAVQNAWYSRGALGAQKAGNQVGFGTQMPEEVRYAVKMKMQTEILSQFKGDNLFSPLAGLASCLSTFSVVVGHLALWLKVFSADRAPLVFYKAT